LIILLKPNILSLCLNCEYLKVVLHINSLIYMLAYGVLRHFQQYFSHIVAVNFIGIGNRSTLGKSSTFRKSLITTIHSRPRRHRILSRFSSQMIQHNLISSICKVYKTLLLKMCLLFLWYCFLSSWECTIRNTNCAGRCTVNYIFRVSRQQQDVIMLQFYVCTYWQEFNEHNAIMNKYWQDV
jgi:hypothetical protein